MANTKAENPCRGCWRITWMEQWDQDFVDEEVAGYFEFRSGGSGEFQFGSVCSEIDYRVGMRDGQPGAEFSFAGNDDMADSSESG